MMIITGMVAAVMAVHGCARPPGLWVGPAWGRVVAPVAMAAMVAAGPVPAVVVRRGEIDPVAVGRGVDPAYAPVALAVVVPAVLVVANAPAQVHPIQAHLAAVGDPAVVRVVVVPRGRHVAECPACVSGRV